MMVMCQTHWTSCLCVGECINWSETWALCHMRPEDAVSDSLFTKAISEDGGCACHDPDR